jgi:hypothetical protein
MSADPPYRTARRPVLSVSTIIWKKPGERHGPHLPIPIATARSVTGIPRFWMPRLSRQPDRRFLTVTFVPLV